MFVSSVRRGHVDQMEEDAVGERSTGQVEMEYHKSKSFIRKKKICGTINEPGIDAQLLTQTKQMKAKNVFLSSTRYPSYRKTAWQ